MGTDQLFLVVGLGNPGDEYRNTRHNVGFMVVDLLADKYAIPLTREKFGAGLGRGSIEDKKVILAKPRMYMNRSGTPVRRVADYFRISGKELVIIHDDIDLAFGRIKIIEKGGHGGHRGIQSVKEVFGGGEFIRLRFGVGRPGPRSKVTDHVLGSFTPEEVELLPRILSRARDAVVSILCKGAKESMNLFNQKSG